MITGGLPPLKYELRSEANEPVTVTPTDALRSMPQAPARMTFAMSPVRVMLSMTSVLRPNFTLRLPRSAVPMTA